MYSQQNLFLALVFFVSFLCCSIRYSSHHRICCFIHQTFPYVENLFCFSFLRNNTYIRKKTADCCRENFLSHCTCLCLCMYILSENEYKLILKKHMICFQNRLITNHSISYLVKAFRDWSILPFNFCKMSSSQFPHVFRRLIGYENRCEDVAIFQKTPALTSKHNDTVYYFGGDIQVDQLKINVSKAFHS